MKRSRDIPKIWIRYIIAASVTGLLTAGFLYLVEDERDRFIQGSIVLGTTTLIWFWVFSNQLPPEKRHDKNIVRLEIGMFGLVVLLVWQIGRVLDLTNEQVAKIFANPLVWFYIWSLKAVGFLITGLKTTEQFASTKGIKLSDE